MSHTEHHWLLLGPWRTRYSSHSPSQDQGLHRLARVNAEGGAATRVLSWDQLTEAPVFHLDPDASPVPADETLHCDHLRFTVHGTIPLPSTTPLALLTSEPNGWTIYLPIRIGDGDALFHRVDHLAGPADAQPSSSVLAHVLQQLPHYSAAAGSHECWYFVHDPDAEYEHKFTLDPDQDIYALTLDIKAEIGRGELARYRGEFRNDFELWQFGNHMFDVTGPTEDDRGYASFIPRLNGGYTLKRKKFRHDSFRRIEHKLHWPIPTATLTEMHDHLTHNLGLHATYLGSFDRTRFDDNLDSSDTGHIYSLMIDRCRFTTHDDAVLQQIEIEYLRSRGNTRPCHDEIIDELQHLKSWTLTYLQQRGIDARTDYTSKHTYLRQLRAHPQATSAAPMLPR